MESQITSRLPACPVELSAEQIDQYGKDGYLAFMDVLTPDEVAEAKASLSEIIQTHLAEHTSTSHRDDLFIQFERGFAACGATDEEVELKVRKLMWFCAVHPHFAYLSSRHPRIRGVVESLIGSAPILFQDMALIKPPFIGSEKPWHQDNAYFSVTPLEDIVGVWIALDAATIENGCMHVSDLAIS